MAAAGLPKEPEKITATTEPLEGWQETFAPVKWGQPPQGAAPPAAEVMPAEMLVPPMKDPLDLNDELLPPRGVFGGVMQDELVGTTTDPYKAAHTAVYEQNPTYHPFPVDLPDGLKPLLDTATIPTGDVWMTGRVGNAFLIRNGPLPTYGEQEHHGSEDYSGPPPLLPHPDVDAEIILPTLFDPQVMPDEKVGVDLSPYFFQTVPNQPENIYNPYPVQQPPTISDVAEKLV